MANEIRVPYDYGHSDVWAMVMFDDSGTWKVRDVVANHWEVYNNAALDDYDIALTEGPLGIYLGNAPSLSGWADGDYSIAAYQGSHADGVETAVVINVGMLYVYNEVAYVSPTVAALTGRVISEMSQGAPSASPTIEQVLNYLYRMLRNKREQTVNEIKVYDDAGTTVLFKASIGDDEFIFTKGEFVSGS